MIRLPRLLNSSLQEVQRLHPMSLTITENIVPLSTAGMVLPREETVAQRAWVELYTPNGSAGIYRAGAPQDGYGSPTNSVNLEHGLCEIGDYIVKADIAAVTKTLSQAVAQVFGYYGGSRWQIGSAASGNVLLEAKYGDNVLAVINQLVSQIPGSMISCNFATSPWTLNIVSRGTTVSAEGRLGRNVQNATVKRDDKDLCTRVYMEGLGTGGAIGYMDADTKSTYGTIEKKISGNADYTQAQAQAVAQSYLERYKRPRYTVTISAADLYRITGESLDQVQIGKKYRLALPDDGVTIEENITQISWGNVFDNDMDVDLTLAEEEADLVSFQVKTAGDVKDGLDGLQDGLDDANGAIDGLALQMESNDREYWTKFSQTDQAIEAEATRARTEEGKMIAKTADFDTVDKIINDAHNAASAAAQSAKDASIAKTNVYQTAEAIVAAAVATGQSQGDQRWIKQTTQYQTADAIYSEAVRVAGNNASAAYLAKTGNYATVDAIITKAQQDAAAEAASAASGCIAKTAILQTADAIVSSAVATSKTYTDGQVNSYASTITQLANKISLVVGTYQGTDCIEAASIVAAINAEGSSVTISASHIDLHGQVSITDLSDYDPTSGSLIVGRATINDLTVSGSVWADSFVIAGGGAVPQYALDIQQITINGTTYNVCVGTSIF